MRPVSWLYVPGDRPDRFARAAESGAHVVVVDLEDAVHPDAKVQARREALAFVADAAPRTVEVRVNAIDSPWAVDDLAALRPVPALRAVRLPKVESADDVAAALDRLDRAASHRGDAPDRRLAQLRQAIEALLEPGPGRAETVQRLFSLDYDPDWQATYGLARRPTLRG